MKDLKLLDHIKATPPCCTCFQYHHGFRFFIAPLSPLFPRSSSDPQPTSFRVLHPQLYHPFRRGPSPTTGTPPISSQRSPTKLSRDQQTTPPHLAYTFPSAPPSPPLPPQPHEYSPILPPPLMAIQSHNFALARLATKFYFGVRRKSHLRKVPARSAESCAYQ